LQPAGKGRRQLLDGEDVGMQAAHQSDQRIGVGRARVDVGREHRQRHRPFRHLFAGAKRAWQDRGGKRD
jgi:hypothetical protein